MVFKKSKAVNDPDTIRIHTLISSEAVFEGNISLSGNIKIDGKLIGQTTTDSDLIASETAIINGNINAVNVLIAGTLDGDITSTGQVTIKKEASVKGDIKALSVIVEEGASYKGTCIIGIEKN